MYVRVGFFSADCDKKYTPAETLQREYGHQVNEDPYKKKNCVKKEKKKIAHNVKDDTEKTVDVEDVSKSRSKYNKEHNKSYKPRKNVGTNYTE